MGFALNYALILKSAFPLNRGTDRPCEFCNGNGHDYHDCPELDRLVKCGSCGKCHSDCECK